MPKQLFSARANKKHYPAVMIFFLLRTLIDCNGPCFWHDEGNEVNVWCQPYRNNLSNVYICYVFVLLLLLDVPKVENSITEMIRLAIFFRRRCRCCCCFIVRWSIYCIRNEESIYLLLSLFFHLLESCLSYATRPDRHGKTEHVKQKLWTLSNTP